MSSQISIFTFENHSIRTLSIDNEPWFIAKDVCCALGIENNRKALLALDDDEKGVTLSNTLGGQQEMNIVSESGMYTLILRCRDAVKKGSVSHRFRKWVTSEVLPQIRKTGKYESQQLTLLEPKQEKTYTVTLKEDDITTLLWLWFIAVRVLDTLKQLVKPLKLLGATLSPQAYSQAVEYPFTVERARKVLLEVSKDLEVNPWEDDNLSRVLPKIRRYNDEIVYSRRTQRNL